MQYIRLFQFLFIFLLVYSGSGVIGATTARDNVYRENVYVHTDRDLYIAGEYINFQAFLLNGGVGETGSGFLYMTLRGRHGRVKGLTLPVENSGVNGSIYIPDTLSTGYYEIFAFTNWMRNFGETGYFRKPLLIVNRFDDNPLIEIAGEAEAYEAEIFAVPEGGSLVPGHTNNLLVRSSAGAKDGLRPFWVTDQDNDTIVSARFNANGFSTIELLPEADKEYRVITGSSGPVSLRADNQADVSMKVENIEGDIVIKLQSAGRTGEITADIYHSGTSVFNESVMVGEDAAFITVPSGDLPHGMLRIEAGVQMGGARLERYWYNCIYDSTQVSVRTTDDPGGTRQKARLIIDGSRIDGDYALFSVSVAESGSLGDNSPRLDSYKRVKEMINRGEIYPGRQAEIISSLDIADLNSYLIDHSILPARTLRPDEVTPEYYLEDEELIITGRVKDPGSGDGMPGTRVILNAPDTIINIKYTLTDDNGGFHFVLPDFYHQRELYLYAGNNKGTEYKIEVYEKFSIESEFRPAAFPGLFQAGEHIGKSQDVVRVNKAYGINHVKEVQREGAPLKKPPMLYSAPVNSYYTENYVFLDSLHEIAREVIHPWRLRLRDGRYESVLFSAEDRSRINEPPVYFIDGILTRDIRRLTGLNSGNIYKIEVHNLPWVHGEIFFPGVIGIYTRGMLYRELLADRTVSDMISETLKEPTVYQPPEYGDTGIGGIVLPDLRQLLFWEGGMKLEAGRQMEIEFYSGDLKGEFAVTVQGVTNDGLPFYRREVINID